MFKPQKPQAAQPVFRAQQLITNGAPLIKRPGVNPNLQRPVAQAVAQKPISLYSIAEYHMALGTTSFDSEFHIYGIVTAVQQSILPSCESLLEVTVKHHNGHSDEIGLAKFPLLARYIKKPTDEENKTETGKESTISAEAGEVQKPSIDLRFDPEIHLAGFNKMGFKPNDPLNPSLPTLICLQPVNGFSYFVGYRMVSPLGIIELNTNGVTLESIAATCEREYHPRQLLPSIPGQPTPLHSYDVATTREHLRHNDLPSRLLVYGNLIPTPKKEGVETPRNILYLSDDEGKHLSITSDLDHNRYILFRPEIKALHNSPVAVYVELTGNGQFTARGMYTALGYVTFSDDWNTAQELMRTRGYVMKQPVPLRPPENSPASIHSSQ